MGGPGLVAMLGAEVAPGAVCDVQPFGDGAQMREVVRAQAAHKNGARARIRVRARVRARARARARVWVRGRSRHVGHGESAGPVPGAARRGDSSGHQNGVGGVFVAMFRWWVHGGV
ncbi:MAG: hypothetical protein Q7K57_10740 [Burkholderiaceae bacterium]|nr:hypothetical protein [Burkholderiaceae bacterium]